MIKSELVSIVGQGNVLDDPEKLKEYRTESNPEIDKKAAVVVRPGNTDELQQVVKWANRKRRSLVPVSSSGPHFRGDSSPNLENSIIVDLRRMNKIIRVDNVNRVAIIEPGVTYGELQTALKKAGMCSYMPLLPRAGKSVLASILEKDPVTMPGLHFDSTDPMLCAEIVFGCGEKMRTGEAAGPDSLEKQWEIGKAQMSPFGPTQMDPQRLVSGAQGTIGIVTWISLKTRFLSEVGRAFWVPSATLEPLIELMYRLTRFRFSGQIFILNKVNLACLVRRSAEEIADLILTLPEWVMFVSCEGYGPLPQEKVQYLEDDLRELAGDCGLKVDSSLGGIKASELAAILEGPCMEPYWKQRLKGAFKEIMFLTTQGKIADFARQAADIAGHNHQTAGTTGVYFQPVAQGTSCHCEFDLYYDPAVKGEIERTQKLAEELADKLEITGAFFSRPYAPMKAAAYRRAADSAEMQKKVKDIFDPNGVLNPGKLCF
jgi:hypothetical protein